MFSAQNDDYHKSGWSRGHMAPAGDNKYDQEAMSATFYLTNVLPQVSGCFILLTFHLQAGAYPPNLESKLGSSFLLPNCFSAPLFLLTLLLCHFYMQQQLLL